MTNSAWNKNEEEDNPLEADSLEEWINRGNSSASNPFEFEEVNGGPEEVNQNSLASDSSENSEQEIFEFDYVEEDFPQSSETVPDSPEENAVDTGKSLAIISIVLAILAPFCGIIVGHVALQKLAKEDSNARNIAKIGLGIGYSFLAIQLVTFALIILSFFSPPKGYTDPPIFDYPSQEEMNDYNQNEVQLEYEEIQGEEPTTLGELESGIIIPVPVDRPAADQNTSYSDLSAEDREAVDLYVSSCMKNAQSAEPLLDYVAQCNEDSKTALWDNHQLDWSISYALFEINKSNSN